MTTLFRRPTTFLYLVLLGLMAIGLALVVLLWPGIVDPANRDYLPLVLVMYAAAIPYFLVLGQAWSLLRLIDKGQAFSVASVKALYRIACFAAMIGFLYIPALPYLYAMTQSEDAPGLMIIGMAAVTGPWTIAVFAATLRMLLEQAIAYKHESDLTV